MKPSNVTYSIPEKGSDSQVKVRSNQSESRVKSTQASLQKVWNPIWAQFGMTLNIFGIPETKLPEGNDYQMMFICAWNWLFSFLPLQWTS